MKNMRKIKKEINFYIFVIFNCLISMNYKNLMCQDTIKTDLDRTIINNIIISELAKKRNEIMKYEYLVKKIGTFELKNKDKLTIYDMSLPPMCSHCSSVYVLGFYYHKKKKYEVYRIYESEIEIDIVVNILNKIKFLSNKKERYYFMKVLFNELKYLATEIQ